MPLLPRLKMIRFDQLGELLGTAGGRGDKRRDRSRGSVGASKDGLAAHVEAEERRADEKRADTRVPLYPVSTATLNRNQSATDFYRDLPP